jgi:DNA-binding PadR family transcriptional regulator
MNDAPVSVTDFRPRKTRLRYAPRVQRPSSELESFVIGLVWQKGPSSPYDIRRALTASPSTQWSASAGAIYPLMRRLEKLRLLKSQAMTTGKRRRRVYSVTSSGKAILRQWVGPPFSAEAITATYDPLRSRMRFLEVLPQKDRLRWVESAMQALDEVERRVRRWHELFGNDAMSALLTRNGELELKARRQWLEEVRRAVIERG